MWKVTLYKVTVEAEEFSLHNTVGEAIEAGLALEDFLGIKDAEEITLAARRSPVTGELLVVGITKED